MSLPTMDPRTAAHRLLRRAAQNGKPIRAFIGLKSGMWVVSDERARLRQSAGVAEITVSADTPEGELADTLRTHWERLAAAATATAGARTPKATHGWRQYAGRKVPA